MAVSEIKLKKIEEENAGKVSAAIAAARQFALGNRLTEAVEHLLSVEKQTRLAGDYNNTAKLAAEIVRLCGEARDWKSLNDNVVVISKRRAQLKQAVTAAVREAMNYVDKAPTKEIKRELIDTLRAVSEGKIHVEVERARLTRTLAKMEEDAGNIGKAADVLQEVQIETITSMEKREKIDFVLDTIRLTLEKKDYIRSSLLAQKISTKALNEDQHQDLKIRFHQLMIRFYKSKEDYLNIMRSYQAMFATPSVQQNPQEWQKMLECVVLYLVMSPYDHEQSDFMHRVYGEKKLDELPQYKNLLKQFIDSELIFLPVFLETHGALKNHEVFAEMDAGEKRWKDFLDRIVEHNIRVVAKFYGKIHLSRLAQLLSVDEQTSEDFVSKMVTTKSTGSIYAKIDRIDGIISFAPKKESADVANEWSKDIAKLLNLVENTVHLINKENMVHKAKSQN